MESLACLAVVPVYESMVGNVCVCYGLRGEVETKNITVKAQIRRFFREHRLDEPAYYKQAREILGIKKQLPLAFSSDCIFFPVKVRVPIQRGDGAYAFVRFEALRKIEDHRIHFNTGEPLDCLQTKRSLSEAAARCSAMRAVLRSEEARAEAERQLFRMEMLHARKLFGDLTKY